MKIHYVTAVAHNEEDDKVFLVKAHTRAGAERFVRNKLQPVVTASVATQDELVGALKRGVQIEDATADPQASIPEPAQTELAS
jgi:hypothetical protein